ncbi:MAG: hypothetical protein A3G34_05675 [Candidatus Lindowbacteria bacterium RIFCSPLOWO2_12_FULL_62_27]|nr:MAG: hypothetical protein A3I06_13485 [Candidatus Lindowbacteria bacterium RIFCSPLOWO2_02_FULL_62_12]OGH59910.1 MAG: hypothetical protein A3G34_05675 [Candidatus Lindowbacteria bacterium RIFCSPLOWO2_12_FULL_62_27]
MAGMKPLNTRKVSKGDTVLREGDRTGEVYHLREGSLLVLKGDTIIGQVKAPTFIGELSVALNRPRSTTVIARTDATLDIYDGKTLLEKLTLQSDMGFQLIGTLVNRFEMTKQRINEYQQAIIKEYVNLLATLIAENKIKADRLPFTEAKKLRRDNEMMLDGLLSHKDAYEDYNTMMRLAAEKKTEEEFKKRAATRFRSFAPVNLKTFKIPSASSFLSLKEGIVKIGNEIAVLSRYLAGFQAMDVGCVESEMTLMEESVPFAGREQMLREILLADKTSIEDIQKRRKDFDLEVKGMAASADRDGTPLAPVAKRFGLDVEYAKQLRKKWKEGFLGKAR